MTNKTACRLYLAHEQGSTRVLGPGLRYAIWLQGCLKNCPGCIFPAGRSTRENGYFVSIGELLARICAQQNLTGLTVSGGEPFLQARGLKALFAAIRQKTSLDIIIYSGYKLEELQARDDEAIQAVLALSDLLIDGEYVEELNNNSLYRGSDNQRVHFLSSRYLPWRERILKSKNRDIEFVQGKDGLFMIGLPPRDFRENFYKAISRRVE